MALIHPFLVRSLLERLPKYGLAPDDDAAVRVCLERSLDLAADQPEALPVLECIAWRIPDAAVSAPQWYAALSLRVKFSLLEGYDEACGRAAQAMKAQPLGQATYARLAEAFHAVLSILASHERDKALGVLADIARSERGQAAHLAHTYLGLEALRSGNEELAVAHFKDSLRVEHSAISVFMQESDKLSTALAELGLNVVELRRDALFGE